jgi:hypothetical protein
VAFARRQWPNGHLATAAALEDLGLVAARRGDAAASAAAYEAALELVQALASADAAHLQRLQNGRDEALRAAK